MFITICTFVIFRLFRYVSCSPSRETKSMTILHGLICLVNRCTTRICNTSIGIIQCITIYLIHVYSHIALLFKRIYLFKSNISSISIRMPQNPLIFHFFMIHHFFHHFSGSNQNPIPLLSLNILFNLEICHITDVKWVVNSASKQC